LWDAVKGAAVHGAFRSLSAALAEQEVRKLKALAKAILQV